METYLNFYHIFHILSFPFNPSLRIWIDKSEIESISRVSYVDNEHTNLYQVMCAYHICIALILIPKSKYYTS